MTRIMSLNLCQKMPEPRLKRFERVADYLVSHDVDVLLFQEGSSGLMDETFNSPDDLCELMFDRGVPFQYVAANNLGALGFLTFKVGVATIYRIDWVYTGLTCKPAGDWFDTLPLPFRRNVVAIGVGDTAFVSTHFYSGADKLKQAVRLMQIINDLTLTHGPTRIILGGDFNMSYLNPAYQRIIDMGFVDLSRCDSDFIFGKNILGVGNVAFSVGYVSDHPGIIVECP